MGSFHKACPVSDVSEGKTLEVQVNGKKILLANDKGNIFALSPFCTHDGAELDAEEVKDHAVTCPRHGAQFDVRDGSVIRMPAPVDLATYETKVEDGEIFVELD
jgi:3-phenylpropionate/trans-cinnamate dioxygenase ferredoxin subunit